MAVEVRVGDEIVGHSIDLRKAAYNERFSEIAARREDFKRQRAKRVLRPSSPASTAVCVAGYRRIRTGSRIEAEATSAIWTR